MIGMDLKIESMQRTGSGLSAHLKKSPPAGGSSVERNLAVGDGVEGRVDVRHLEIQDRLIRLIVPAPVY